MGIDCVVDLEMENEHAVRFGGADGHGLGGFFYSPEAEASNTVNGKYCCIVTHPHPKLGGDMWNNVVMSLTANLQRAGFSTLRFNTRGVGPSQGWSTWRGLAERDDVRSAIEFAMSKERIEGVFIVGYSFGACIGFSINENHDSDSTTHEHVKGYALVSYPYGYWASYIFSGLYRLGASNKPKMFIMGTRDQFSGKKRIQSFMDGLSDPKSLHIVENADHFWFGQEKKATQLVLNWLDEQVKSHL